LADGQISPSGDNIRVDLIQPGGLPPTVRVTWPAKPTIVQPRRFAEVAGAAVRILAGLHQTVQNQSEHMAVIARNLAGAVRRAGSLRSWRLIRHQHTRTLEPEREASRSRSGLQSRWRGCVVPGPRRVHDIADY
jgi:hypothetical protein